MPPGATELLLVRHGESASYVEGTMLPLLDGQGDPELHPEGLRQADLVADRLQDEPITAIYVTPLRRTQQTAAPLVARTGIEPVVVADLREVFLGEWEGGPFRQYVREGHPLALQMRAEQRWDVIPGAEPAPGFAARIRRGILGIAARHPDETVVVVVHGGVIGQVLAEATGSQPFAFTGADNASVSQVVVDGGSWVVRRFNDTAHLDPGLSARRGPEA